MFNSGKKAFERCDVKVVEFKDFVYTDDERTEAVIAHNPSEDDRRHAGTGAVLHCPVTEDDRVSLESQYTNYKTRLEAYDSLRVVAGAIACKNCKFSAMTPLDIATERAALAKIEAERIENMALRAKAIAELVEIDPRYKDIL